MNILVPVWNKENNNNNNFCRNLGGSDRRLDLSGFASKKEKKKSEKCVSSANAIRFPRILNYVTWRDPSVLFHFEHPLRILFFNPTLLDPTGFLYSKIWSRKNVQLSVLCDSFSHIFSFHFHSYPWLVFTSLFEERNTVFKN